MGLTRQEQSSQGFSSREKRHGSFQEKNDCLGCPAARTFAPALLLKPRVVVVFRFGDALAGYIANNQDDAAATLGIDSRTLQRWIKAGCPGENRHYEISKIIDWARENKWGTEDDVLIDSVHGAEDVKERLLKERADKVERENRLLDMKISERESELVNVAVVKSLLLPVADRIRESIQTLERKFGPDAAELVLAALGPFDKTLDGETFDRGERAEP